LFAQTPLSEKRNLTWLDDAETQPPPQGESGDTGRARHWGSSGDG